MFWGEEGASTQAFNNDSELSKWQTTRGPSGGRGVTSEFSAVFNPCSLPVELSLRRTARGGCCGASRNVNVSTHEKSTSFRPAMHGQLLSRMLESYGLANRLESTSIGSSDAVVCTPEIPRGLATCGAAAVQPRRALPIRPQRCRNTCSNQVGDGLLSYPGTRRLHFSMEG